MKKMVCKIVYRGVYGLGPRVYIDMFNFVENGRTVRASDQLLIEPCKCNTKFGERNLAYRDKLYWNALPLRLKTIPSLDQFKNNVKKFDVFD